MSESQFFSFRRTMDWERGVSHHLNMTEQGLSIRRQEVYHPAQDVRVEHPQLALPLADVAIDPTGRWYMLDNAGEVWQLDMASGYVESVLAQGHGWFGNQAALTVLSDFWVAIDASNTPSLIAFSSSNAQILWTKETWQGRVFQPVAVTSDAYDRAIVLANFPEIREFQLIRFNAGGAEDGSIRITLEEPVQEISSGRFQIAMHANGVGWLLDQNTASIARINFTSTETEWMRLPEWHSRPISIAADAQGGLWLIAKPDQLQLSQPLSLIRLNSDMQEIERGYTGVSQATHLILGADQLIYVWDGAGGVVTQLRPQWETAIWPPLGRRMGVWISGAMDSTVSETEWHKLQLDADIFHDTQVKIKYYASDRKEIAFRGQWVELDMLLMDQTLPPEQKLNSIQSIWSEALMNPRDALLIRARGRYLWVMVELIGSESNTPTMRGLRIYFPRKSYLDSIPAIYQREERSREFIERYLSLYQTILDETEERIRSLPRMFDPDSVSGTSLRWLLGWIGLQAEDHWTNAQLRRLVQAAPLLQSLRGTRLALETIIAIYTGEKPIILEYDEIKPIKEHPELTSVADQLYITEPYGFNVLVKPEHADTETKRVTLQHLIDSYKPAFTVGKLIILQPWVYMDLHSYLGLNTVLSEPTLLQLDGMSSMPHHTITIDVGQDNRVDQHTRIELDSRLE